MARADDTKRRRRAKRAGGRSGGAKSASRGGYGRTRSRGGGRARVSDERESSLARGRGTGREGGRDWDSIQAGRYEGSYRGAGRGEERGYGREIGYTEHGGGERPGRPGRGGGGRHEGRHEGERAPGRQGFEGGGGRGGEREHREAGPGELRGGRDYGGSSSTGDWRGGTRGDWKGGEEHWSRREQQGRGGGEYGEARYGLGEGRERAEREDYGMGGREWGRGHSQGQARFRGAQDDRAWRHETRGQRGQGRDELGVDAREARDWDFEPGGGRESRGQSWELRGETRGQAGEEDYGRDYGRDRDYEERGESAREGRQGYGGDRY